MKPSKLLTGLLIGATLAPATLAAAAGPASAGAWWLAASAVGQTGAAGPTAQAAPTGPAIPARPRATIADRKEVDKLLVQARQAMKDGNLELADSFVSRAEAMRVEFPSLTFADTPKKARHDLEQRRRAARPEAQSPSKRFKPSASLSDDSAQAPPSKTNRNLPEGSEPSLGRATAPIMQPPIDDGAALPGMERADATAGQSPFGRRLDTGPPPEGAPEADITETPGKLRAVGNADPDARRRSDALVLAARRAIAQNDLRRAAALVEQATALNVAYGIHDDTPAKVEALLRKAKDIADIRAGQPQGDGWRRQYADLLMEQAEQLLRYKEYDEAERLAMDASRLKANYSAFDANPDGLLGKIDAARKGLNTTADNAVVQAGATARQADVALGRAEAAAAATAGAMAGRAQAPTAPAGAMPRRAGVMSKDQVLMTLAQARAALAAGDIEVAEQFARQAEAARLPESAFQPQDDRAWKVLLEVQVARNRNNNNNGVTRAGGAVAQSPYPTTQALYDSASDPTRNAPAAARSLQPADSADTDRLAPVGPLGAPDASPGEQPSAMRLFQEGEQAMRDRDTPKAREKFRQAYALRDQLDPVTGQRVLDPATIQRLQDHLQLLTAPQANSLRNNQPKNLLDDAASRRLLLFKQMSNEVAKQLLAARSIMPTDPQKAAEMMEAARQTVEASTVDPEPKAQLLKRVENMRVEIDKYIEQHRAQIDADAQNKEIANGVEARRRKKLEIDDRLATMINECNGLMEEHRWAEAEVVAKRVAEIAPNNPISKQLMWQVKFAYRVNKNQELIDDKEKLAWETFNDVELAAKPFGDETNPIRFPDAAKWKQLVGTRAERQRNEKGHHRSERDLDIERKLKTPVSLSFKNKPLREALNELAKLAAVNLYLDPEGLTAEGIDASTPVDIELTHEITLKSALKLILEPLHLGYVIKDEVLKITSEQLKDGEIYPVTYNVADLVIPIPNFVPNSRIGMAGNLADAYSQSMVSSGMSSGFNGGSNMTSVVANQDGSGGSGMLNPVLAQQMNAVNGGAARGGGGSNQSSGFVPGGMGGGNQADFDPLIQLITSTINPTSWDEVGGPGTIAEFKTNLSLVISQTQDIHAEIADLLSQLRRLQDLQVTIEVRFITLNDNFFEQIGVDFNVNIENLDKNSINVNGHPTSPGAIAGLTGFANSVPTFTSNLDIPFSDNSFTLATPQFGQPTNVASFGFALLSDIEAYFLVNASQGDRRSNVMQAPKVTLFNGQQAFVSDTSQTPFVISVIPVVGDFAAAQQPVIVVLSEGTFLTVQAVVSADRRFVRLTVVPFFSQIGNVQEFTFQGSNSSTQNSSSGGSQDVAGDQSGSNNTQNSASSSGITVQLPTFSFVTVTTTVSVPDGGTVLLGGVKRLSEGRNEFGVPILSKLPYINRLFKNVGIGRETQSLMMMVTPRIIIAEEEESLLGIQTPTAGAP